MTRGYAPTMGGTPTEDYGAPVTTVALNITQQERARLRVRVVHDPGWPHLLLTAMTSQGDIEHRFGLDEAGYLARSVQAAVEDLALAYEPAEPRLSAVTA